MYFQGEVHHNLEKEKGRAFVCMTGRKKICDYSLAATGLVTVCCRSRLYDVRGCQAPESAIEREPLQQDQ
ncbi:hypothetical protein TNCV_4234651 [Trichonephila clavipes]|nr:hypothetical protein TNCV_4234651 [Trichonephila clavipes]